MIIKFLLNYLKFNLNCELPEFFDAFKWSLYFQLSGIRISLNTSLQQLTTLKPSAAIDAVLAHSSSSKQQVVAASSLFSPIESILHNVPVVVGVAVFVLLLMLSLLFIVFVVSLRTFPFEEEEVATPAAAAAEAAADFFFLSALRLCK